MVDSNSPRDWSNSAVASILIIPPVDTPKIKVFRTSDVSQKGTGRDRYDESSE